MAQQEIENVAVAGRPVDRSSALQFPAAIFLSAFLLFQVEPIMGRYILPWFGGGPAVWTACLLFFQVLLLAGYVYVHWLGSRPSATQAYVHLALLALSLLFLPVRPNAELWKQASSLDPSIRILLLLVVTVGGPYFLLSATGPLLQRWVTLTLPRRSPWRLYALSNLGSLLALLTYPFAVEPYLRLNAQIWMWSALYAAFVGLCGWTAWRFRSAATTQPAFESEETQDKPGLMVILFWVALSASGSTLLVATTNQISQEIAVNPFLWVAPLAIYLLTFIFAFESDRFYHRTLFACLTGVLAPVGCVIPTLSGQMPLRAQLGVYLAVMFVTCMVCHGELAKARPSARYLTTFYVAIAAGGALGGIFVALIAPHLFTEYIEYPIGLAAACLLAFVGWMRTGSMAQWTRGNLGVRLPLMAMLFGGFTALVAAITTGNQQSIASARNFYGILRVVERLDKNGLYRELRHGRTRHGFQYLKGPQHAWPTSYYGPHSGVAIALNALDRPSRSIAVIGLGTGTLAAWGRPGDKIRFYEINPDVVSIAHDWFTFLKDSKARTETVLGDARVQFEREGRSGDFDLIAVDAFSSDAIPFHLLTAEAAQLYQERLKPGGLLLLHISNRVLNLEPVARGMAQYLGWKAVLFESFDDQETGESGAKWVLLTGNSEFLEKSGLGNRYSPWSKRAPILWTDDFVSLWHVLNF